MMRVVVESEWKWARSGEAVCGLSFTMFARKGGKAGVRLERVMCGSIGSLYCTPEANTTLNVS